MNAGTWYCAQDRAAKENTEKGGGGGGGGGKKRKRNDENAAKSSKRNKRSIESNSSGNMAVSQPKMSGSVPDSNTKSMVVTTVDSTSAIIPASSTPETAANLKANKVEKKSSKDVSSDVKNKTKEIYTDVTTEYLLRISFKNGVVKGLKASHSIHRPIKGKDGYITKRVFTNTHTGQKLMKTTTPDTNITLVFKHGTIANVCCDGKDLELNQQQRQQSLEQKGGGSISYSTFNGKLFDEHDVKEKHSENQNYRMELEKELFSALQSDIDFNALLNSDTLNVL